jgi:hypothetical protein
MLETWRGGPLGALIGGVVVLLLCAYDLGSKGVNAEGQGQAFAVSVSLGADLRSIAQQRYRAVEKTIVHGGPSSFMPDTTAFATGSLLVLAAFLASNRARSSQIARRSGGIREPQYQTHDRKWWHIKEDRDPTTLPHWQRDFGYGHKVLQLTMIADRKKQRRTFWDVRVLKQVKDGYQIEMLNSGLIGFCPSLQEGPAPLKEGDVVKMECIAAPQKRVNNERGPWLKRPAMGLKHPIFSHKNYLNAMTQIEKAKELKAGDIVDCTVHKKIGKGILMNLDDSKPGCHGMLAMVDISRLKSSHKWCTKMFPPGTKMKCYVIHSCERSGRITLGTKELEDDDHMGWMISFPERVMANAENGKRLYEEKREAYIQWLQR